MTGRPHAMKVGLLLAVSTSSPAFADAGDNDWIAKQACTDAVRSAHMPVADDRIIEGKRWRRIEASHLAYFIVSNTGRTTSEQLAIQALAESPARNIVFGLQRDLVAAKLNGFRAFSTNGEQIDDAGLNHNRFWAGDSGIILRCLIPDADQTASEETRAPGPFGGRLRLRGTVDALAAEGDDRTDAEAATISFQRVRTFLDDGSRKQVNTYALNAVLGFALIDEPRTQVTPYVSYELKRERTLPAPVLVPPATLADGDTNVLKVGLQAKRYFPISGTAIDASGTRREQRGKYGVTMSLDGAYMINFVDDSERLRGRLTAGIYTDDSVLGICGFGSLTSFSNSSIWTQCDLEAIVAVNALTKRGTLPVGASDSFSHSGVRLGFKAYAGEPTDDGLFFSGDYLRLWRIDGLPPGVPEIRRHSLKLGYRWWSDNDLAFEIKAELIDGINPDSLADENSLSLGFGLIF